MTIINKTQIVKVYNPLGVFLDVWRDCPLLGWQGSSSGATAPKFAVNTITSQVTVTLPRRWDNYDEAGDYRGRGTIGAGNVVQFWVMDNSTLPTGKLVFQGYIDAYEPSIDDADHETVQVTLTPSDTTLGDVKFIGTQQFGTAGAPGTYVDPVTMFDWPFNNINAITNQPYTYPLTLNSDNPTTSSTVFQLQFHNQTPAEWFEAVRTVAPQNWFWRTNIAVLGANPIWDTAVWDTDRWAAGTGFIAQSVTFQLASTTPKHTFIVGKHINQPQYQKDYTVLKNDIYVKGTAITARATSADVSIYGQRTLVIVEPRIIDQNTANRYATAVLAEQDVVNYRSTITVVDSRGDTTGLGYDIETITQGDTCRISNPYFNAANTLWDGALWDTAVWDFSSTAQINQTVVIASMTYQFDNVVLELSILQPSQDRFLLNLAQQFESSQIN